MKYKKVKEKVLQFLQTQKLGVISTLSGDQPQSAFVYFTADEELHIYFAAVKDSRKYQNINNHSKVSFAAGRDNPPQTVQLEGIAEIIDNKNISRAFIPSFLNLIAYQAHSDAPLSKMNLESGVVVYRIKPTWLRWSDYSYPATDKRHKVSVMLVGDETIS